MGAADAQLAVKRATDGRIIAKVEFAKDFEADARIACELDVVDVGIDEDGETITSCVVVPADAPASDAPQLTPNPQTMLSILREAGPDGLTIPEWNHRAREAGLGNKRPADLADLRKALERKGSESQLLGREMQPVDVGRCGVNV